MEQTVKGPSYGSPRTAALVGVLTDERALQNTFPSMAKYASNSQKFAAHSCVYLSVETRGFFGMERSCPRKIPFHIRFEEKDVPLLDEICREITKIQSFCL